MISVDMIVFRAVTSLRTEVNTTNNSPTGKPSFIGVASPLYAPPPQPEVGMNRFQGRSVTNIWGREKAGTFTQQKLYRKVEKLDQNLKFPQIVKKGEICINEYIMIKNVPVPVRF